MPARKRMRVSTRDGSITSYSPRRRLSACMLVADGRLDAEVLGVVLRAADPRTMGPEVPLAAGTTLRLPVCPMVKQQPTGHSREEDARRS
jgi:hypothetical protein